MRLLGLVLVHGVNASAQVWDAFAGLMAQDGELARAAAEPQTRFAYATGLWRVNPLRAIPSITTAAESLKEYLATEAADFERLVLVGHSQGGLVIQRCLVRMLQEGRGAELARIRRVVQLATPNTGSQLLLTVRRALVRRSPQERQLRPYDELVNDTLAAVIRDIVHAPPEPTGHTCRIPFSVFAGEQDGIVSRASAQAVFRDAAVLPGDHFTIAEPTDRTHRTYTTLRRLLLESARSDPPQETVATLGPAVLEVHTAGEAASVQEGRSTGPGGRLTAYLPRRHDAGIRAVLSGVLAGGASRLVVLTGESSTGKTRALYEALLALAPDRPLLRPVGSADLLELVTAGRVEPGCVLWLNEADRFLYDAVGENAAGALRALLERTPGIAAVATLWTTPHWKELTSAEQPGASHAQARALLKHPAFTERFEVLAQLTADELREWGALAASHRDPRLGQALHAGAEDGRVIQHLSGGPELLDAYLAGPGKLFTAREHALVTAALDARRLGHLEPLPVRLLEQAADGDLPARHRAPEPDWAERDLRALSSGARADGSRADVRNTLSALTGIRLRAGEEPRYEPADYLDQHTRRTRADRRGSPALWQALIEHTADRNDQDRLARAAWNRGLRTTAVRLWHKAVASGHTTFGLVELEPALDPDRVGAAHSAAHADPSDPHVMTALVLALRRAGAEASIPALAGRAAAGTDLGRGSAVADLLRTLRTFGPHHAVETLLARDPAAHVHLADRRGTTDLLMTLRGLKGAAAERDALTMAERTDLTDPHQVINVVQALQKASMEQAFAALLARDPVVHVDVNNPYSVADLLSELHKTGAEQAVEALALRAGAHTDVTDSEGVWTLSWALYGVGQAMGALSARADAVADVPRRYEGRVAAVDLTDTRAVAHLMGLMQSAWADSEVRALLARDPAAHVDLTEARALADFMGGLRTCGSDTKQAVATLLARDPGAHVELTDPAALADLLGELETRDRPAVGTLLARDPAAHVELTDPAGVARLLHALRRAEAPQAVRTLAARAANRAELTDPGAVARLMEGMGTEGSPAVPTLLARDPAAHVELTDPAGVADLLHALRRAGAPQAVRTLAARAANRAEPANPVAMGTLLRTLEALGLEQEAATMAVRAENAGHHPERFAPYGREPDGRPSPPWTLHDLVPTGLPPASPDPAGAP